MVNTRKHPLTMFFHTHCEHQQRPGCTTRRTGVAYERAGHSHRSPSRSGSDPAHPGTRPGQLHAGTGLSGFKRCGFIRPPSGRPATDIATARSPGFLLCCGRPGAAFRGPLGCRATPTPVAHLRQYRVHALKPDRTLRDCAGRRPDDGLRPRVLTCPAGACHNRMVV